MARVNSRKRRLLLIGVLIAMLIVSVILIVAVMGTDARRSLQSRSLAGDPDEKIQLVHVFFRHGQRTPADTYPTDPYLNETFSPYGWGQLTNFGKKTLYEVGSWLRSRYVNFLGQNYYPEIVHAQSTGVSRTQASIALVLASLFPPRNTPLEWNYKLNWQPIPYSFEPLNSDTLLLVRTSCPRYPEALKEVENSEEIKALYRENAEFFAELANITGRPVETLDDIQDVYSTLKAEEEFGLELPAWTKRFYPTRMQPLVDQSYILNVYTDELKRIKGGPFLRKTLNEWKAQINGTLEPKGRKIYVYAGHDSTVVNILSAFKVWRPQFPGYASMGVLELFKNEKTGLYSVQILQKKPKAAAEVLTIPGCDKLCPINKLEEILQNIITQDFKKDCTAQDESATDAPLRGP